MRLSDYILSGFKNLSRQKTRTALTITAITVGSFSVILMISLLIGVRQSLLDSFRSMGAMNLVTMVQDPNNIENSQLISSGNNNGDSNLKKMDDTTIATVKKIPHVVDVTPIGAGFNIKMMKLEGQDKKTWPNTIAYDPDTNVFELPLIAGRNLTSSDMDKIVVGKGFLSTYGLSGDPKSAIGKKIILISDKGWGYPDWGEVPPKPTINKDGDYKDSSQEGGELDIPVEIVGVVDNSAIDDKQNYINIAWAHKLATIVSWGYGDEQTRKKNDELRQQCWNNNNIKKNESGDITSSGSNLDCDALYPQAQLQLTKQDNFMQNGYGSIILKVDDTANIKEVAENVAKTGFGVTTAENMIDQMNQAFALVGLVLGVIGGISLFVAAIGIINTMIMATYERIREIGVMRACGATRATIRRLFTFEAALLGFWGGIFGMVVSFILGQIARLIVNKFGASLGNIPIENVGKFPWWLVLSVIAFTTLIGLVSGLYPAIRAAKLNPVEALRYE